MKETHTSSTSKKHRTATMTIKYYHTSNDSRAIHPLHAAIISVEKEETTFKKAGFLNISYRDQAGQNEPFVVFLVSCVMSANAPHTGVEGFPRANMKY